MWYNKTTRYYKVRGTITVVRAEGGRRPTGALTTVKKNRNGGSILVNIQAKDNTDRKKRKLSAEKKYQILEEIKVNPKKKAEILRREGLYRSDIIRFETTARTGAIKALEQQGQGKKKVIEVSIQEYERIKCELEAKDKTLADLAVDYMILKKKVNGD